MKKYIIRVEKMGGDTYYMIYLRLFWIFYSFFERWNDIGSATTRINELNSKPR